MSLPLTDRNEYAVSSLGFESEPQGIVVKNSLWTLQIGYNRLILKDYEGNRYTLDSPLVTKYRISPALKNDLSIDTDRIWIWIVSPDNTLSLYEIEPFASADPIITYTKLNITINVDGISAYVTANDVVRLNILYLNGDFRALTFANIRASDSPLTYDLTWSGTRLNQFFNTVTADRTTLLIRYLDTSSPPNVYTDSYVIDIPTNLSVSRIGITDQIAISWDAVTLVTGYILERDTHPLFPSPEIFTLSGTSYTDTISEIATFYYRVRAVNDLLALQSLWSDTESVEVLLDPDFVGEPLTGQQPLLVQFTDLSTPLGIITAWNWDFGDGTPHSTEQNPSHTYSNVGVYTVTLTSYVGVFSASEIKTFYITVLSAGVFPDFVATPLRAFVNEVIQFTDLSLGNPTFWDWNFGDRSVHATDQNPVHSYASPGFYTVTLRAGSGFTDNSVTKVNYIEIVYEESGTGFVRGQGPTLIFD